MDKLVIRKRDKKTYKQFTCRIEVDLIDKLREISEQTNLPINTIIYMCIEFGLDNVQVILKNDE